MPGIILSILLIILVLTVLGAIFGEPFFWLLILIECLDD